MYYMKIFSDPREPAPSPGLPPQISVPRVPVPPRASAVTPVRLPPPAGSLVRLGVDALAIRRVRMRVLCDRIRNLLPPCVILFLVVRVFKIFEMASTVRIFLTMAR